MVKEKWLPVRQPEGAGAEKRELVLQAVWPRLKAEQVRSESIDFTWPGVPQPVEPNTAEYTVEVKPKQSDAKPTIAVTGTTKTKAKVQGLAVDTEVQIRVSVKIVGPYATDFRLVGPWQ